MKLFPASLAAALLLMPVIAKAEPPMSAEAFDTYATGKTMTYSLAGRVYGTEEYLPGRRVRWAFTADICQFGSWYQQGEDICFLYDGDPEPHCWKFWDRGGWLDALAVTDAPDAGLSEVAETEEPLACAGPDVGV
ncbi:MAG: hypothetical protein HC844_17375 [Tabrizicola sp.]|nr:hypothetical protein [Tabrizicola sp.]